MSLYSIILIAVGLAMDAFAVSVCKGLSMNKVSLKNYVIIGAWFGGFQALMPLIGFFIGSQFKTAIESFDHYVAFALLAIIGFNMIRESFSDDEEINPSLDIKTMLILAIATSIDALAVGITFALSDMDVSIFIAVSIIAVITFIISVIGVKLGNMFGEKYKARAEIAGGIILILLGIKILLEHLGIIDVIF